MISGPIINLSSLSQRDVELLGRQLSSIIASPFFKSAPKMQSFLEYVIGKGIAGEGTGLKQYTIAVEALNFPDDFDSDSNPAVRILAGRVRDRLKKYYEEMGKNDPLVISIPKGGYLPILQKNTSSGTSITSQGNESQGPKIGVFTIKKESDSDKTSKLLLSQHGSRVAEFLNGFTFSRLYAQIPYTGKSASNVIGSKAKKKFDVDFSLLLYVQKSSKNKHKLIFRFWDNLKEEIISSGNFTIFPGQSEKDKDKLLNQISILGADFYVGKVHAAWSRDLMEDPASIPEENQVLAYFRHYFDHQSVKRFENAVSACKRALDRNSQDRIANIVFTALCRLEFIYGYNQISSPLEAGKRAAELVLYLYPESYSAHFKLAQIFFCMGKWDACKAEFSKARRLSPNNVILIYRTGLHFCLMNDWDKGLALVKRAMKITPVYPSWFHFAPFLRFFLDKNYQQALAEANKIIVPHLFHGPVARCVSYVQLGELDKAQDELQVLIRCCPEFPEKGRKILFRFLGDERYSDILWESVKPLLPESD